MNYRAHRLAEELKNEISTIIAQDVRDPRVGFATVTKAEVSPDLRHARIYVSIYGSQEEKVRTLQALAAATPFIRRQVGARIRLRHVPELLFSYDDAVEYGDKMMQLIDEIKKELPE